MKYIVEISAEAKWQLRVAASWYSRQDREVGEEWYDGFLKALSSLTENPQRCGLAREQVAGREEFRILLYGSGKRKTHRAIFRIIGDVVDVIAIRHFAQDDLDPEEF